MRGRILRFGKTTHQTVEAVLPWFVNGTLEDPEKGLVEHHLQDCVRCQREVEWLRMVNVSYAEGDENLACEQAWGELKARLGPGSSPWERLRVKLNNWKMPRVIQTWAPWVAALELALILVVGGAFLNPDSSGRYHTLAAGSEAATTKARLVVMFESNSTVDEANRILHEADARVIDGPTATDAYVLSISNDRFDSVVNQLHREPAVKLVESLDTNRPK